MISASTSLKDLLNQSSTFRIQNGCTIEYNWNTMTDLTDSNVTTSLGYEKSTGVFPFKKFFPADSIIRPNRPQKAGIKYAVLGDLPASNDDPKLINNNLGYRVYYPGLTNTYKYWISKKDDSAPYVAITYPKDIITNKIVIKFEVSHAIPPTWEVWTTSAGVTNLESATKISNGTNSAIPAIDSANAGILTLYYTGSAWSTDASLLSSSHQTIRTIKLKMGQPSGYIGVIELSPRYIKDISDAIESFSVTKESSSSQDDVVPVGSVSSNSLQLNLSKYNTAAPEMVTYQSASDFQINQSKIYMYKNAELRPYIKIYHSGGSLGPTGGKYDNIYQGYYYIDTWSDTAVNDVSINAFDGAKILQETIAPYILCENYSIIAVIRRLLDAIGFTSYNFNIKKSGSAITDSSVMTLKYWWTEEGITVWQAIQELCRDTQMTAVFDENNTLQFYTREYLYDSSRSSQWTFRYERSGVDLPNIESISKLDIPPANQVKILWQGVTTSEYGSDRKPLWTADSTYLAAAGLTKTLNSTDLAGSYVCLTPITIKDDGSSVLLAYSGYLAIQDEIIEYDAIEYSYIPLNETAAVKVDIESKSDFTKYKSLAKPSSTAMTPTGRYRIKERGALGTTSKIKTHAVKEDLDEAFSSWSIAEVNIQ